MVKDNTNKPTVQMQHKMRADGLWGPELVGFLQCRREPLVNDATRRFRVHHARGLLEMTEVTDT